MLLFPDAFALFVALIASVVVYVFCYMCLFCIRLLRFNAFVLVVAFDGVVVLCVGAASCVVEGA